MTAQQQLITDLNRFTNTKGCPQYLDHSFAAWLDSLTSDPAPAPVVPTPSGTPGEALNIGPGDGQNHFEVQVAPTGARRFVTRSMGDIAAGYAEPPYFTRTTDGVQFAARMDGPTTSGSKYPRCELREVNPDGTKMVFDLNRGRHVLSGRTRITHLPPVKPEVVVAQLHNGNRDRIALRTQKFSDGTTKLIYRVNGTSRGLPHLEADYTLGAWFDWSIEVDHGVIRLHYNGAEVITLPAGTITEDPGTCYFKAGAYAQSNDGIDAPDEWVRVEMAAGSLDVTHEY